MRAGLSSTAFHAALVVAVALAVSAPALDHGLVFDDHLLLDGNAEAIRGDAPISTILTRRYWGGAHEAAANELYRPATILSLALGSRLLGAAPDAMHAVNSALHAANAALAYAVFRALPVPPPISLLAALLFAVHPIATEAVVPISGRSDLLATLFVLASTLLALSCRRASGAGRALFVIGAAVTALLGALSKESAFAAPLVTAAALLAAERLRGAAPADRGALRRGATVVVAQIAVLAGALALRAGVLGYFFQSTPPADPRDAYLAFVNNPIQFASAIVRVLTALRVVLTAGGLLVFPLRLSADYSFDQIPVFSGSLTLADIPALGFAAAFVAAIFFFARRAPAAAFALVWIAATYLPASNLLFPTGTIFGERLLYLPLAGFSLLAAIAIGRAAGAARARRIAAGVVAVALVVLLGARFVARASDWSSDATLFESAALTSSRSAKAHSNHGFTLQAQGRLEEAGGEYRRALEIAPKLTGARVSLARCLVQLGRPDEALVLLAEERKMGDFPQLAADLAGAHYAAGARRLAERNQAAFLEQMTATIGFDPSHGPARYNLALDALNRGDLEAARAHAAAARESGYTFPPGFLERLGVGREVR